MNTKQMQYFIVVADTLNFRKAAEQLHMTQPPLSQQIAALEEDLGVKLFERNRRTVELTEAGKTLLHEVRHILASIAKARQHTIDVGTGKTGRLSIGFVGPAIDGPLASDIKQFRNTHPNITFDLHEMSTPQQLDSLRNDTLDAGIIRLIGHDVKDLETMLYHSERYVLAVPTDGPFSRQKRISLSALDNTPMIMFSRTLNPVLHDAWTAAFSNAGVQMNIVQEATTKHTSVALVAAGHGVTPVPESTARTGRSGVTFVQLEQSVPTLELHAVFRRTQHSPLLAAFLSQLSQHMDKTPLN